MKPARGLSKRIVGVDKHITQFGSMVRMCCLRMSSLSTIAEASSDVELFEPTCKIMVSGPFFNSGVK